MLKKIFGIAVCLMLIHGSVFAADYYVDCTIGNDNNTGTQDEPFATIQKAADVVTAGDVVNVMPGVYYGPINVTTRGEKNKPIIFRAVSSDKNETIITNANKAVRENGQNLWEIYDEAKNIWVTDYTVQKNAHIDATEPEWLFPARVLCDDVDIIPYQSLNGLENEVYSTSADSATYMPGYSQGYYYDITAKKLYLRLRTDGKYGSSNPNLHTIKVAPSMYEYISVSGGWGGGAWCGNVMGRDSYNICIGEYEGSKPEIETRAPSYYVEIDGFTFETPGYAGVFCRASNIVIRNCFFLGCRTGVRGAARVRKDDLIYSDNILIEHCDYSQFPVYDDAVGLICDYVENPALYNKYVDENGVRYGLDSFFWWQRKNANKSFNYESGGFTNFMGENWTIRYNYIHDCFDGISYQAMQKYENADGVEQGSKMIKIYGNKFEKCLDNAIEFENHGTDIRVYENYFYNNFVPVSWQPLGGTPWPTNIRFYKNVIHNTRDFNQFWKNNANFTNYVFKFGVNKSNWQNYSWMSDVEWDEIYDIPDIENIPAADEGVWIFNNTIVSPESKLFSNVGGSNMSRIPFFNFRFVNNAVITAFSNVDGSNAEIKGLNGLEYEGNVFAQDHAGGYTVTGNLLEKGVYGGNANVMGFKHISRLMLNPEIEEDSILRESGVADRHEPDMSRDVGALNYGEEFMQIEPGCIVR